MIEGVEINPQETEALNFQVEQSAARSAEYLKTAELTKSQLQANKAVLMEVAEGLKE